MHEFLLSYGQVVMHNVLNVRDIQTARGEVCAYENVGGTVGEAIDGFLSLTLVETAVEGADHVAFLGEELGCALHAVTIVEKDDGLLRECTT